MTVLGWLIWEFFVWVCWFKFIGVAIIGWLVTGWKDTVEDWVSVEAPFIEEKNERSNPK